MSKIEWPDGDDPRTPEQKEADERIRKEFEARTPEQRRADHKRFRAMRAAREGGDSPELRARVAGELKHRFGMDAPAELRAAGNLKVPPGSFPIPEIPEGKPVEMPELNLTVKRARAYDAGFEFFTVSDEALVKVERAQLERGMQFMVAPRTLGEGPLLKYGRCGQIVAIDDDFIFYTEITGVFG